MTITTAIELHIEDMPASAGRYHRVVETLRVLGTGYRPEHGDRFGVIFVPVGCEARKDHGGPMVPGPWASAHGLCTVVDNFGGTAREAADRVAAGLEHVVNVGDVVEIEGERYTVELWKRGTAWIDRHNIMLVPVPGEPVACAGTGTGYWNCDVPGGCSDCRSLAREIGDADQLAAWKEDLA